MNHTLECPTEMKSRNRRGQQAAARPVVLMGLVLLVGVAVGVVWMRKSAGPTSVADTATANESAVVSLSEATLAVLQRLPVPVEIRFYSVLNESEATAPRRAYTGRIAGLLAEYERAGQGRIIVKRFDSATESGAAAAQDGVEPVRLGRNLNYLGLAVACQGQKAVMSNLTPEWEAALEFDLSRAIARVASGVGTAGEVVVNPTPVDAAVADELLKTIPGIESLSVAEAMQKVKAVGLEEFNAAAAAIQEEMAQAQQRLAEAQKENPEAEQAARHKLQQLQADQNEKLAELSARMQARLAAVQQLKRSAP